VDSVIQTQVARQSEGLKELVAHEPLGAIANISAWNYPYFVGTNVIIPALLTGNTVLYKPSEYSSITGLNIVRLLHQAGVPKDVIVPIIGKGLVGETLLKENIDGVFFTGSNATGQKIAKQVAGRMIRVQLELGGKDPTYVCDNADAVVAAKSLADGAMYNTGQSCCSVERIYVHQAVYDTFMETFISEVKSFKVGDPQNKDTYIGPLTLGSRAIATLENQVKDAIAKGGKVVVGGKKKDTPSGCWFEPTVIINANNQMEVMREESFGPIIGIQKVSGDEEAISLMNDNAYGLTAGVYSSSSERAQKILAKINAGTVYWNACDRVSPFLPWSGRKGSGIGSTLGIQGIMTFVQPKAYHLIGK